MRGAADRDVVAEDSPGVRHGEIVLAQVQDVGAGGEGDVRPVVDRQQRAVPGALFGDHGERGELGAGFQTFLAELDDVDPAGEGGGDERTQVRSEAGAQVQDGLIQSSSDL